MSRAIRHTVAIKTVNKNKKYSIIIPAAGEGVRMITYGVKSLININGDETIISRQLNIIKKTFTNYEIILVSGFESDKLMNKTPDNIIKIENSEYKNTNVVKSIGMALRAIHNDKVVIIYGDLVFTPSMLKAPLDIDSMLLFSSHGLMKDEEVGCSIQKTNVEHMTYGQSTKWSQISYFTGKELQLLRKICYNKHNSMLFGYEAINKIINHGGKFKAYTSPKSKIIDIDTSKDLSKVKDII